MSKRIEIKKLFYIFLIVIAVLAILACFKTWNDVKIKKENLIIFNAGSLSIPLTQMKKAYEKVHPNVNIMMEGSGSRTAARKIADLHEKADIMMSADYAVINNLLIPKYALWDIKFTNNQMAIVYTKNSKYAGEINSKNWYKILQRKGVKTGHSNANDDPCGYSAMVMLKLAAIYYKDPELFHNINDSKNMIIRPEETNLLGLLQTGSLDYALIYKSLAKQHHLKYISLPVQLNLSSEKYSKYYKQVSIRLVGKKPGTYINVPGAPMIYGLTIPKNAPNQIAAIKFLKFVLGSEGQKIMKENGQGAIVPAYSATYQNIPTELKKFAMDT